MLVRCWVLLGVFLMSAKMGGAMANSTGLALEAAEHEHWHGVLVSSTLPDGSILSEYTAQTFSTNLAGARLSISFAPRFNCTPMISVSLAQNSVVESDGDVQLAWDIDGTPLNFDALADSDEQTNRYSFNAVAAKQDELRKLLDTASWVTVTAPSDVQTPRTESSDNGTDNAATGQSDIPSPEEKQPSDAGARSDALSAHFSLLGSMITTLTVERRCSAHAPIPFEQ